MAGGTLISDAMRGAVGRELSRTVSYPVSESDIRRWAVALYYPVEPPQRFWDARAAEGTRWGGIVAPEDFNPFAWMAAEPSGRPPTHDGLDPDSTEYLLGIDGPGLKNQLNGGVSAVYGEPMRPGDVITLVRRLAEYSEREGRFGPMLFTVFESAWTNQRDELVLRSRFTLIRY